MSKMMLMLFAMLIGCGGSRVTTTEKPDPEASYDESFDPFSLGGDDIVIPKKVDSPGDEDGEDVWESIKNKYRGQAAPDDEMTMGFRVQIFSSLQLGEAIKIKYEASSRFKHEVYLDYEAPAYKVRVGNFKDKEKADALSSVAQKSGYFDAWVVKTKVLKNPGKGD